jgi:S-formylglutathione hydrolase
VPLSVAAQYASNLNSLRAVAFDAGLQDNMILGMNKLLDEVMTQFGIPHAFEAYEGTHTSKIAERVETKALPLNGNRRVRRRITPE